MENEPKILTLLEVARRIQETLAGEFMEAFWVKAEINKLNLYPHSGHCYPELVEKRDGKVVAEMRANLWRNDYQRINAAFLKQLREPLRDGISVLILGKVSFDPVYGLAIRILDIDPSFSLGELEREKQETIARLVREGLFTQNKSLTLPLLPRRIAVISVETSKGYSDFRKVLDENPWGYRVFYMLFPALLQGEGAIESITGQLRNIRKVQGHFDAVAIIRGGGGDVGLSCYNHYALASQVAQYPLPVLTGIGHSTNETVTEMVAYRQHITPTELADFILQQYHNFAVPLREAESLLVESAREQLAEELSSLQDTGLKISKFINLFTRFKREGVLYVQSRLDRATGGAIAAARQLADALAQQVSLLDPSNVLRRGFSITTLHGKAVTSFSQVSEGDLLETRLSEGSVNSIVRSTKKQDP